MSELGPVNYLRLAAHSEAIPQIGIARPPQLSTDAMKGVPELGARSRRRIAGTRLGVTRVSVPEWSI